MRGFVIGLAAVLLAAVAIGLYAQGKLVKSGGLQALYIESIEPAE